MTREEQKQLLTILSHQVQSLESIENFTKKQSIWINIDKKQLVKMFENMNK